MSYTVAALAFVLAAFFIERVLFNERQPKIKGIPEIPGWPIVGNLLQLGDDHAKVCMKWAQRYGPVFQVRYVFSYFTQANRLGYKRVVVANTYQAVKELWIDYQTALISRPMLYTFHTIVSSSQGFTIGTSPWDESCKRRRKAAASALNRPAVASYMPIIDLESKCSIRDLYLDSAQGTMEINPKPYFQRFALNTVCHLLNTNLCLEFDIELWDPNVIGK
jgi:phenylacetate 2-hydroxylase